ncbi:aldehyde ferredoxin oxidoreductase family protein [Deferribacter abyssi]|uniref:aldehyde ferredoxin oxidoreductase family protein n=1 Tax=Deferribacter abyssi TaxID=213806 RepID=UPI003C1869C9
MLINDSLANVLYIDLTNKCFWVERREDLFNKNIGGSGVAISLLHEECPENCDPLSPESPIIFTVGPLTGLFPLASKTVAMFKSPHTKNLGESHCGGRSAIAIRMAGYGAIVIKGKSDFPIYLAIHDGKVFFRDASALWGMSSSFTVGRIIREKESGDGLRTIMRIGRAGEKLVSYACVTTETYRHFGRLGLGAVFGSKNLKAIVISGKKSLPVVDMKQYKKLYSDIYKASVSSSAMKKYHDLGTPQNVLPLNELGGLPTYNLKERRFKYARELSGENFAENFLGRRVACAHCPVGCVHIAVLREPYGDEPYFYKTSMISYDYEPIYALGFMLGLSDAPKFLKLMDKIEILGLDVMSTGVILAWATEALERGMITTDETMGVDLKWGELDHYLKAVDLIVEQPNEFYYALANGVEYASSKYGGKDFALAFGKNEMPGYHTGPAAYLGYSIGARHSHLDNAGYSIDQKILPKNRLTPKEMAEALISEEQWRQILSSIVICFFAREIYKPEIVSESLKIAGLELGLDELKVIGKKILYDKYRFKFREGFSFDSLRLPKRIFETPSPLGKLDERYMRNVIEHVKEELDNFL